VTARKPYNMKKMGPEEGDALNRNLDTIFSHKLESKWKREGTTITPFVYQQQECGEVDFTATGSPTVALTFALQEKHSRVIFAQAHAKSTLVTAHVTDITATSITVTCRTVSGTANFSSVATATVKVFYSVVSSDS
jgi:hypothetical protein